jgi:hypothetical protein
MCDSGPKRPKASSSRARVAKGVDEVAEVGGVVERVPVAYLDRGDANRHGVLFVDAHSVAKGLRKYAAQRSPYRARSATSASNTTRSISKPSWSARSRE